MGDAHRIIKSKDKKYSDPEFELLLQIDPHKLRHYRNPFFVRPAYQYTKAETGGIE